MKKKPLLKVPFRKQEKDFYCGPASLQMVLEFFGEKLRQDKIAKIIKSNKKSGTSRKFLSKVALDNGLKIIKEGSSSVKSVKNCIDRKIPIIVNFIEPSENAGHYAVIVGYTDEAIIMNDPWNGKKIKLKNEEFLERWNKRKKWALVVAKN